MSSQSEFFCSCKLFLHLRIACASNPENTGKLELILILYQVYIKMGLLWSSSHGKVQNNPQLNKQKGELTQDDSDTNGEETFYEAMSTELSPNDDQILHESETQSMPSFEDSHTKSRTEYQVSIGQSPDEQSVPWSDISQMPSNMDSFDIRNISSAKSKEIVDIRKLTTASCSLRSQNIPSKEPHTGMTAVSIVNVNEHLGKEKVQKIPQTGLLQRSSDWDNSNNTCTTGSRETLVTENLTDPSQRVQLFLEDEQIKECSTLLMSEENISHEKHSKSSSEPETSRAEISSKQLESEIPSSCAWQIDVDCFKSKKRKKLPKKYLRSKEDALLLDHTDDKLRTVSTDKQNVDTRQWLAATEIATQEMMAKRKVLDLRRW